MKGRKKFFGIYDTWKFVELTLCKQGATIFMLHRPSKQYLGDFISQFCIQCYHHIMLHFLWLFQRHEKGFIGCAHFSFIDNWCHMAKQRKLKKAKKVQSRELKMVEGRMRRPKIKSGCYGNPSSIIESGAWVLILDWLGLV